MRNGPRRIDLALLKDTWAAFNRDKALRLAAAIAYSTIFSIAPLFIIITAFVGWAISVRTGQHGQAFAESVLLSRVDQIAGPEAAGVVREMMSAAFDKPRQTVWAQIVGWGTFIFGATAVFTTLQDALNSVWQVESVKAGLKNQGRSRLLAFSMVMVVGVLLIASLAANVWLGVATSQAAERMHAPVYPWVVAAGGQVVTFAIVSICFAAIFKVLPCVYLDWRDVWIGAIATSLLFVIGENAISLYFRIAGIASAYGAAGSLLVMLLWIYYSAVLILLGSEFTKVRAGTVATTAPAFIRRLEEEPAGIDPRGPPA